jgi:hypothetical protein
MISALNLTLRSVLSTGGLLSETGDCLREHGLKTMFRGSGVEEHRDAGK